MDYMFLIDTCWSVHTKECYISVDEWKKLKKLKSLGMPRYLGSGSHECNGQKYRFVVMDRYGTDLWSRFLQNKRVFTLPLVLRVGLQVVSIKEPFSG
jgi:vaccinia related kinase